ncbi:baculoviral IAP repeat-containing protein 5 isoform X2 [Colletes gigas]|nr:baculoviral IAP repeat-containing protein 5 isoform X2 [Colletes gigas]
MDFPPEVNSTFWKAGRLKTFENWPFQSSDNLCNPDQMASAGFFAIGSKEEPDLVECFICSKQLDGWDPNDNPWDEHMKHQKECPFIKLNKPHENLWTVQNLFQLFRKYKVKECTLKLDESKAKAEEVAAYLANKIPQIYKELRKSYKTLS